MTIKEIIIQPSTMGELNFRLDERNPLGEGIVTLLDWSTSPTNGEPYIQIKVDDKLFAEYHGVPFAVLYK